MSDLKKRLTATREELFDLKYNFNASDADSIQRYRALSLLLEKLNVASFKIGKYACVSDKALRIDEHLAQGQSLTEIEFTLGVIKEEINILKKGDLSALRPGEIYQPLLSSQRFFSPDEVKHLIVLENWQRDLDGINYKLFIKQRDSLSDVHEIAIGNIMNIQIVANEHGTYDVHLHAKTCYQ